MKLRPYQLDAEESIFAAKADGAKSALGVMPTGCGKTIVFASAIRRMFPKKCLVIAHRQELIWQAVDKIKKVTGLTVDVEMGEYKARTDADMFHLKASVVVCTIQTLTAGGDGAGRMGKFNPDDFGLVIVDEAHHSTSPSYRKALDYFKTNPDLFILGVTATPDRSDEEALGQIFDVVAFDYEILDAIRDGWLVPIQQQFVHVSGLDYSQIRTTAGDLNGADLASVMEAEKPMHKIVDATIEIIGSKRGIGFASSVEHARMCSEIMNRHKPGISNWVCGSTDKDERKLIISDFSKGKVQWLWNCAVFTEGFDDSGIEVISMGRPTKSRSLYAQMAGRATRPHESIAHTLNGFSVAALRRAMIARSCKPSCLIIDFVGNSGKHKLITTADILGGNVSDEVIEAVNNLARKSGKPVRMDKSIEEEEKRQAETKARQLHEQSRKANLVLKAIFKTTVIDPFKLLQIKPISNERGWNKGKQFTEPQRGFLKRNGFNPDNIDYTNGKQIMDALGKRIQNHLCTPNQAATLTKHKCSYDPTKITFSEASSMIQQIADNGWRKPANFVTAQPVSSGPPPRKQKEVVYAQKGVDDDDIPF